METQLNSLNFKSTIVPHLYIIFAFQQEVGVLLVKRVTKTQAPHLQKVHYVTHVTETEMEKLCTKVFRVYSVKCHESREEEETIRNRTQQENTH